MRRLALVATLPVLVGGLALAAAPQMQQAPTTPATPQVLKLPASPRGLSTTQVGGKWVAPKPDAEPRYQDGKWITVDYGRPILRGRTNIFGSGADYGKKVYAGAPVWRAGANQTTRLHTEVPLTLGGKTVQPGDYSVFVDLKEGAWTLILSTQPFQQKYDPNNKTETWGAYNYDPKFDVLRAPMKVTTQPASFDQFAIEFVNMSDTGGTLAMIWEKTHAAIDFKVGA